MADSPFQYLVSRSYDDFDELAVQARQWDLDLRQLDAGQFRGEITQFGLEGVHISEARFGRVLKQGGSPPLGLRTIAVPASDDVELEWRGAHVDSNSLMVFPAGAELDALSHSNFHVFTCSFPEVILDHVAQLLEIDGLHNLRDRSEVVRCGEQQMPRLRSLLRTIFTRVDATDPSGSPNLEELVTWELPRLILTAQTATEQGSFSANRRQLLQKAEDFIEQRADEAVTVAEVCQAVPTSLRTLQYAFAEKYGISPKAYIRAIRLNRVRKELRMADPAHFKVADIAGRFGFWHMGQFAADYRRHFGELPSQTLSSA